ncbi:MAG: bifunctional DNA-formamidopyrimidine glycosylase/DNA-(apurinic or apyrimidinic site) lyase [Hyphomicrobiaceae bacterium]
MPELPEVETVMRGLAQVMEGYKIVRAEQRRADLRFPLPENFATRLMGRRVQHLTRRAKYILAHLDRNEVLAMHLGMTGRFTITPPGTSLVATPGDFTHAAGGDQKHDHVVFHLANGAIVTFNDARRFGYMDLIPSAELDTHKHFAGLGPEPLSNAFNAAALAEAANGRRVDLKSLLLDQRVVAGLGNIYVVEALFRVGLKPSAPAQRLADRRGRPTDKTEALVAAIRAVLGEAIEAGGSTLRDYRNTDGELGYFQKAHQVYDRDGKPCLRPGCGGVIRRTVQAGRSSFHCPRCQR